MTKEAEVFGLPKGGRGMAMVESIEAVKALWTQDVVTFEGKYVHLQDVTLGYKPLQQPHPPIWIGAGGWGSISTRIEPGTNTKPFDRVAQLGDGWFMGPALPSEFDQSWTTIRTLAQERGRDPQSIHRAMEVWININDVREKAFEEGRTLMEKYYQVSFSDTHLERAFLGTPADVATKFESFLKAGAQTFVLVFHAMDPIEQMKKFADDVLPSFQNRT
jgi:alkanesulfonate monooxygenase SsuD/methylene tetrahydromethanopterin reductase-like flavin-dependent oxidoreductase (luciferase family)